VQAEPGAVEAALRAAQCGDLAAFNRLVQLYERQVYNVCYRTLGNVEDAADATQDAFLAAYRGLKTFHGPATGFRAWLLRVAINACYDQLRRRKRRPVDRLGMDNNEPTAHGSEEPSVAERLPDPDPGPEQRALSAETASRIQSALERLSPEQRLTVVLCDVQGLSYDEAAEIMDVELGTVKSRLSRARAQLRELLAAVGELPAAGRRLEQR
jgi:RNA polymerase sigma-70 factor (ECF subfamily)